MHLRKTISIALGLAVLATIFACGEQSGKQDNASHDTIPAELKHLNSRIAKDPANPAGYYARARWLVSNSRFENAFPDIRKILDKDTLNPDYFAVLGDLYLGTGNAIPAEEAYLKALRINPAHNDAMLGLARYFLVMKNYEQTFALTAKAIIGNPMNPRAYYLAAWGFAESGDTLSALKNYLKAVDQDQDFFDAYLQLGILYGKKQARMAVGYYRNAIRLKPNHLHAQYLLGLLYQETGQIDQAIQTHQAIIGQNPAYVQALFALGHIQMAEILDFLEAIAWFDRVLETDNRYAPAYLNRAYCYEQLGQIDKARADYKQALSLQPGLGKAIEGLNRIE